LPALPPLLMVVMYGSLACYVSMGLPFYDNRMNRFRAGASTVTATMALGALILVLTGADAEIFTATWVAVGVLGAALGSMLPVVRRRQLLVRGHRLPCTPAVSLATALTGWAVMVMQRFLMSIRPRMLEELAARHDVGNSFRTARGRRRVATGSQQGQSSSRWLRVVKLANIVRNMQYRQVCGDVSLMAAVDLTAHRCWWHGCSAPYAAWNTARGVCHSVWRVGRDYTPGNAVGVCRSYRSGRPDTGVLPVFHGRDPTEVALLVRLELEQPGMLIGGLRKQVPTLEAVEHALWLFAEGIEECVCLGVGVRVCMAVAVVPC